MTPPARLAAALLASAALAEPAMAQSYETFKCRDGKGRVTYSDMPCGGVSQTVINAVPNSGPTGPVQPTGSIAAQRGRTTAPVARKAVQPAQGSASTQGTAEPQAWPVVGGDEEGLRRQLAKVRNSRTAGR
jgi:hypothetical protein